MANPYSYDAYNGNNAPEYNVNGDAANGRAGSYTPQATRSRASQPPAKPSGNPYGEILQYVRQQNPYASLVPQSQNRDVFNGGGVGGPSPPAPQAPATASPGGETFFPGGHHGGGTPITPYSPVTTGPAPSTYGTGIGEWSPSAVPQTNQATGRNYGRPLPSGVDPALWDTVDRWVKGAADAGADYSWLYDNPNAVSQFRQWQHDNHAESVDPVDYFAHMFRNMPNGLAKRSGTDTFETWWASQKGVTNPNAVPAPTAPTNPADPNTQAPPIPQDQSNWKDVAYPSVNDGDIFRQLMSFYGPANQQAQGDLAGQLRGQAALTGDINSGGFGDVLGRQEGRLIANQQADLGDKYQTAHENALNRALERYKTDTGTNTEKYSIDTNKFLGMIDQDTKRYGIKSNADLQKYLGDQSTGMQKYGIDSNRLLQAYQAELQLRGVTYSADKQFDAEALRNATTKLLGDQNYNLGLGQLGFQQYEHDNPSLIDLLKLYAGMSPEQLALAGMGGINWPSWLFSQNGQPTQGAH